MNLIVNGKLNKRNLLGYLAYIVFGIAMNLCIPLNMYFATVAGVNVGLVTIIWRASVFIGAFLDYVYFRTKMKYYHYLGILLILICVILIGIDNKGE